MEMDALCIWAFRESECVWQTVNQPVMRGNRTVDRSISYFLRRQTEEKHHCSPGKWFAFHSSFISLILLVYLSFCFLPSPPFLPSVCLLQSLSTLNLAVWMFISAHFSSCPSHREGGGDPADQGWVMVYELSLWAMRAPLGWIIYTGPCREQTYVSQSHQRHSKAGLSVITDMHTQLNCKNTFRHATCYKCKLWLPEVQNSTFLLLHFLMRASLKHMTLHGWKLMHLKSSVFLCSLVF